VWGFVVRDHEGQPILGGAGRLDTTHDASGRGRIDGRGLLPLLPPASPFLLLPPQICRGAL
jgi:hypothetical protein